ncbi:MAG: hypothetical protein WCR04_10645 [Fibrobacteraceae bacterium]
MNRLQIEGSKGKLALPLPEARQQDFSPPVQSYPQVVAVSRCSILTPAGPAQSPALRILTFPKGNRLLIIKMNF